MVSLITNQYGVFHLFSNANFSLPARNAVFSHLTSTINGVTTVRAYRVIDHFQQRFHQLINGHTAELFGQNVSSRIFCLLVDLISLFYITFVLLALQLFPYNQQLIGVCLASMFNLIGIAQWACKRAIDSDFCINSYRNLLIFNHLKREHMNDSIKLEANEKISSKLAIEIKQMSAYYDTDLPKTRALTNINVHVEHGEKIGICGRSGAGKSTLINTLLRLVCFDGQIRINGHCIRDISTFELRRQFISIIPQCPVLFDGTIRENLHLLFTDNQQNHYDDHDLWQVLDLVGLGSLIRSFEYGIDQPLIDGKTISVGQKQLLCLARILLQHRKTSTRMNSKLIIMDEAFAHIDLQTDHQIRQTLRERFAHCTMLIIAHRLNTIMDCNRIWVLDDGKIIEDGSPLSLLYNGQSHFSKLVNNNCDDDDK